MNLHPIAQSVIYPYTYSGRLALNRTEVSGSSHARTVTVELDSLRFLKVISTARSCC